MKTKTLGIIALLAIGCLTLTGCNKTENPDENAENAEIANPASVYCEEQGGTLQIENAEDGSQYGICMFNDGSYCEEWSYFRDECQPGEIIYNTISDEVVSEETNGEEIENSEVNDEESITDEEVIVVEASEETSDETSEDNDETNGL